MSRLVILMYHMVANPLSTLERKYACPPARFEKHVKFLRSRGFKLVSLGDVHNHLHGGKALPPQSIAMTFDDGFCSVYENARPILEQFGIPATVFVVAGLSGKTNLWMEEKGFPSRKLLSWQQIRELHESGIDIGSHTVSHPNLCDLSADEIAYEVCESKKMIGEHIGRPVNHFAYPYGHFTQETRDRVEKEGYSLACSARSGFNSVDIDPFLLRRIEVYGTDTTWKLAQKITFGTNDASLLFPVGYYWGRLRTRFS